MKVNGLRPIAHILELEAGKLLSKAKVGDIIRAQVVSKSGSEVILSIDKGQSVIANMLNPLELPVGKAVDFIINEKRDGKIFIETLKSNPGNSVNILSREQLNSLLASLNLSNNPRNVEIINELAARELPVTRKSVQTVLNYLSNNPGVDIQKAVFLACSGIGLNEKSIGMLSQYTEGKAILGEQIKGVIKLVDSLSETEIMMLYEKLSALPKRSSAAEHAAVALNRDVHGTTSGQAQGTEALMRIGKDILPVIKQALLDGIDQQIKSGQPEIQKEVNNLNIQQLKQQINGLEPNGFRDFMARLPEALRNLILQILKNKPNEIHKTDLKHMEGRINTEHLRGEIKAIFEKHFVSNRSETLAKDLQINASYKEILVKLDAFKAVLAAGEGRNEMLALASQAEENIKFMNSMSQYNTFIQIPLNIGGQHTHGELYILKKSRKKIDLSNASILMSLEMPNMGLTEVLVSLSGRTIGCTFRVQDDKIVSLIRENTSKLVDALNQQGYSIVNIDCGLIQKKTDLTEMDKAIVQNGRTRRLSFDVRV